MASEREALTTLLTGWDAIHGARFARRESQRASPLGDLRLLLPHDITDSGQICGEAVLANPDGTYQWGGSFILTPVQP